MGGVSAKLDVPLKRVGQIDRQKRAAPRILIVTKRVDLGGAKMHFLRVIPALRSRGINVLLFVLKRGGRLKPDFARSGVGRSRDFRVPDRRRGTCRPWRSN